MLTQEEIESSKIELAECLSRLQKNKDFKKLITEGYLESGSMFLTRNLTKVKPEFEDKVVLEMKARSILMSYMDSIEEEARSILEARTM
jgi:hypothetical protein